MVARVESPAARVHSSYPVQGPRTGLLVTQRRLSLHPQRPVSQESFLGRHLPSMHTYTPRQDQVWVLPQDSFLLHPGTYLTSICIPK